MKIQVVPFVVAALVLGAVASASAQVAGPKGTGSETHQASGRNRFDVRKEVLAKLNLSEDQKKKIKQLYKSNKEKTNALKAELEKSNASDDEKNKKLVALRKEQQDALRDLLTADQQKQFDAMMKEEIKKLREERQKTEAK